MKTLFKQVLYPGRYPDTVSLSLLILRLSVGTLMLTHGIGKFLMFFSDSPIIFADPIGLGFTASLILAVFAELFCSLLIIMGLGTRLAAIPLLITMWVAAFIVHAADPLMIKELALLYSFIYVVMVIAGPGKYSLDYLLFKK